MMEQAAAAEEEAAAGPFATLLDVRNLRKSYGSLVLFENLSFHVRKQQMLAIVGQSGAGKSTLLHILGALDTASSGDVYFKATLLRSLSPVEAADFRHSRDWLCLAVSLFTARIFSR